MRIPALKFVQSTHTMFIFITDCKTLYEKFGILRRIDNKTQGYQRAFSTQRINQIKNYILKENGILPSSILVNLEAGKHFYDENTKELVLTDETSIGFIIDGQHRVKGSYEAEPHLLLPVVATVELDIKNQAQLFVKINSTQKSAPVSLYLDLLDLLAGGIDNFDDETVSVQRRAREIAIRLNEDEDSPFFGLVRRTGEPGRGIALSEFVNLLKEYVAPKNGKLVNYEFEQQYIIFKTFFKAVKSVFPNQWEDPNSLILKTVGFGGLMKAFFDIFVLATQKNTSFSLEGAIHPLNLIKELKFDNHTLPGGGVMAQEYAGKIISSRLKEAIRSSQETIMIHSSENKEHIEHSVISS